MYVYPPGLYVSKPGVSSLSSAVASPMSVKGQVISRSRFDFQSLHICLKAFHAFWAMGHSSRQC